MHIYTDTNTNIHTNTNTHANTLTNTLTLTHTYISTLHCTDPAPGSPVLPLPAREHVHTRAQVPVHDTQREGKARNTSFPCVYVCMLIMYVCEYDILSLSLFYSSLLFSSLLFSSHLISSLLYSPVLITPHHTAPRVPSSPQRWHRLVGSSVGTSTLASLSST